jgi:hypothetical protein
MQIGSIHPKFSGIHVIRMLTGIPAIHAPESSGNFIEYYMIVSRSLPEL